MTGKLQILALSLLLALIWTSGAMAKLTLIGYFFDTDNAPVSGFEMELRQPDGKAQRCETDAKGRLSIVIDQAGEYVFTGGQYKGKALKLEETGAAPKLKVRVDDLRQSVTGIMRAKIGKGDDGSIKFLENVPIFFYEGGYNPQLAEPALTNTQKIADLNYLFKVINTSYPFLWVNARKNDYAWQEHYLDYFMDVTATKTDLEFYTAIKGIVGKLNNDHTQVLGPSEFVWMSSLMNTSNIRRLLPWYACLIPDFLLFSAIRPQLDVFENSAVISKNRKRYNDAVKGIDEKDLLLLKENENIKPDKSSDCCSIETLENGKVLKIKFPTFANTGAYRADWQKMSEALEKNKDIDAIIIDIQGNSGGFLWYVNMIAQTLPHADEIEWKYFDAYRESKFDEPFLKAYGVTDRWKPIKDIPQQPKFPPELATEFQKYSEEKTAFSANATQGKAPKKYLLVNKKVYSAGECMAQFCKMTGFAKIVGSRTGGDGVTQSPAMCVLPNSGLVVRYSVCMGLNADGSANEEFQTEPDVAVDADNDPDAALNKALELIRADLVNKRNR